MRKLTPKRQRFVELYIGECGYNATRAAEMAGFGSPRAAGSRLCKELAYLIDEHKLRQASYSQMAAKEVIEKLTDVARDSEHKDHVRALELLAKIHGLMSEKIDLKVDRKALLNELDSSLHTLVAHSKSLAKPAKDDEIH